MGGMHAIFLAHYNIYKKEAYNPLFTFYDSVEIPTQYLVPLIGENGIRWVYEKCNPYDRAVALKWYPIIEKSLEPIFDKLYDSVKYGTETKIVLEKNNDKDYRNKLNNELIEIKKMDIWKFGKTVRILRDDKNLKMNKLYEMKGKIGFSLALLHGMMSAQYNVLRKNGHSPSECVNETIEEFTQSLCPLVGVNGMDWMYSNCSTTAQRGALDWYPIFQSQLEPIIELMYQDKFNINTNICSERLYDSEMLNVEKTVISLRHKNTSMPLL
jgi:ketol-acid reductoisomerase